ncbi:MAG: FUSC family membrane protein [Ferruginibacter sp.]
MTEKTQHIRYFLFSQFLADGVRITLEIILPALILSQFGRLDIGLLLSTGALCASISDAPGPLEHKRNGMLYCNAFVFAMAVLTGFVNHNILLTGLMILFASFFFTMFTVYGNRASSVGIAALLIMILRMDKVIPASDVIIESLWILCGGIWYMLIALLFFLLRPYRQAQRSLGACVHETAKLLLIKAALYDPSTDIKAAYQRLLDQQIIVSEKQDEVRELLFKDKQIVKDSTPASRALLITFTDVVDLYDKITASWYDYYVLRERFSSTGILPEISAVIKEIAHEVDKIGFAIQSNIPYKKQFELLPALNDLKANIDAAKIESSSNLVLKKILINLRNLGEDIDQVYNYFTGKIDLKTRNRNRNEYSKFVSHQEINLAILRDNLSLSSSIFRHSLRMMIACVAGFVVVKFISYGHYSYWILLTIVFILKPGYSITKQRNIQRIAGTIAGGLVGVVLIATIKDTAVLVGLIAFFMIGTYTFQRLNYVVTVIFMTPYILILFSLLGLGFINIVEERILDTAIASVLAFVASYFLFPHWESKQVDAYMINVLKANLNYLLQLKQFLTGQDSSIMEYRLVRKELYVSTANLSATLNRMLSEPKNTQHHAAEINEFVVLNNILSSNIASLLTVNIFKEHQTATKEVLQSLGRAAILLEESLAKMDSSYQQEINETHFLKPPPTANTPDQQIKEHVDFIYRLAADIRKIVLKING